MAYRLYGLQELSELLGKLKSCVDVAIDNALRGQELKEANLHEPQAG